MMQRYFWIFALLPLTACSTPTTPRVHVSISVDWEGRDLSAINLNAFRTLRKAHPNVPLTHFLNAAYFTKRDANATRVQADIRRALRPGDELGLHIHPWKTLVEAAGVKFRTEPTIWGKGRPMRRSTYMGISGKDAKNGALLSVVTPDGPAAKAGLKIGDLITKMGDKNIAAYADIPATVRNASGGEKTKIQFKRDGAEQIVELTYGSRGDSGHEIAVEAYTTDEFEAITRKSQALLQANGFEIGHSFRAGAWLAGPHVREAIRRAGFLVDSSSTDTVWHDEIAHTELPSMMKKIWPTVTRLSQPFLIETPAGMILEMPDTGALADYVTAQEMSDHVDEAVNLIQNNQDRYVHIGFHQETAARYLPRVTAAIKSIKAKHGSLVVFETLETSAQHARQNNSTLQSNGHGPQQLSNLRFALAILPPDQDRGSRGW
jgi:phosphotransferase system HPr-like phosphotransfer protein